MSVGYNSGDEECITLRGEDLENYFLIAGVALHQLYVGGGGQKFGVCEHADVKYTLALP